MNAQDLPVAIVSGAGRGIGASTARLLADGGHHVIVNYLRDSTSAKNVVAAIEADGGSAEEVRADVRDAAQVAELVDRVRRTRGRVDVLVCNANTAHPPFAQLEDLTWETFADKVNSELSGVFHLTRSVLPLMRTRGSGSIVYVSSVDGDACAGSIAQSTAKSALNQFSRHVAAQAGHDGIAVNTVAPGSVRTDASATVNTPEIIRFLAERSVFGRQMEPEEMARVIVAVAGAGFAAVTGQVITADAGMHVLDQQISLVGARKKIGPA